MGRGCPGEPSANDKQGGAKQDKHDAQEICMAFGDIDDKLHLFFLPSPVLKFYWRVAILGMFLTVGSLRFIE